MSRIILLSSALVLTTTALIAGPKCDEAKQFLAEQKTVIENAIKAGQVKWNKKVAIPAKINLLEVFIKKGEDTHCDETLKSIQQDVEALKQAK